VATIKPDLGADLPAQLRLGTRGRGGGGQRGRALAGFAGGRQLRLHRPRLGRRPWRVVRGPRRHADGTVQSLYEARSRANTHHQHLYGQLEYRHDESAKGTPSPRTAPEGELQHRPRSDHEVHRWTGHPRFQRHLLVQLSRISRRAERGAPMRKIQLALGALLSVLLICFSCPRSARSRSSTRQCPT